MHLQASVLGAVLTAMTCAAVASAQAKCPVRVDSAALGKYGYGFRNGRCEGILAKPAGGDIIRVIGLTAAVEDFDPRLGADLRLTWPVVAGDSVWLTAVGTRPQLFYRMDAFVGTATVFRWPVGVLLGLAVRQKDVAIRGWTLQSFGPNRDTVLVPITVSQTEPPVDSVALYLLTVIPTHRLTRLRWGLNLLDATGRSVKEVRPMTAVPGTDFLEGSAVRIPIVRPASSGLYRIQLAGDLRPEAGATTKDSTPVTASALVKLVRP
jgi:hypothetical protein